MELAHQSKGLVVLLVLLAICSEHVQPCSITSGWVSLQMSERLLISDIVVYGKTTQHKANVKRVGDRAFAFIDAVFDVHCVLKAAEDPVPEEIIIERISPRDGCSGTRDFMQIGQEAIVALRQVSSGNYRYHEVVPTLSATFLPSRSTLFSIASVCDIQRWTPPLNATVDRCPICGQSTFTDEVDNADIIQGRLKPCIVNGEIQTETDGCELMGTHTFDNTSICISPSFLNTCTRLIYNYPMATCECNDENKIFTGYGDVGTGSTIVPSMAGLMFTILAGMMSV